MSERTHRGETISRGDHPDRRPSILEIQRDDLKEDESRTSSSLIA
jgi:hypothetical protein